VKTRRHVPCVRVVPTHDRGFIGRSTSVFEYIFTPDEPDDGPPDGPRTIDAKNVEDAIQILFLRELRSRGVAGTIRARRLGSRDSWVAHRYDPRR
jgi:hypothetical protein